ncbi:MAG TPA: hypothetical protein VLB68_12455 [Pyrinomonadaceae bacterium]|nr:hypothetical protein [Pyrinomonadaceae bacterium]
MNRNSRRRQKKSLRKLVWLLGATGTICALLYWEQTALLYVVSTLAMCDLMLVVAFSKLEDKDEELNPINSDEAVTNKDMKSRGFRTSDRQQERL